MQETEQEYKPLVLIVDDVPKNLQVLGAILYEQGYEIAMADNGKLALSMIGEMTPDLILLDIMMPEMDGFEVCRVIKSDPGNFDIPVIFLTAKHESESIVKGFEAGAVDYITKPFNAPELLARVKTHIDLTLSKKQLIDYNHQLKELMKKKDEFLNIAAHDMRNPLGGIIGFANLLTGEVEDMPELKPENKEMLLDDLAMIKESSNLMLRTVNELLNTETLNSGRVKLNPKDCIVYDLLLHVLNGNKIAADTKKIAFHTACNSEFISSVDGDKLREVMENLVSNAIKFSPAGRNIYVSLYPRMDGSQSVFRFSVRDEGQGLTEADKAKVFGRFQKLSARPTAGEPSSGLGLSIVKMLVELQGGKVWVESEYSKGAEFIVELPLRTPEGFPEPDFSAPQLTEFATNVQKAAEQHDTDEFIAGLIRQMKNMPLIRVDSPELFFQLENEYMARWESVSQSESVNSVREFALDLKDIGRANNVPLLEDYGIELNRLATVPDSGKLAAALASYPKLVEALRMS